MFFLFCFVLYFVFFCVCFQNPFFICQPLKSSAVIMEAQFGIQRGEVVHLELSQMVYLAQKGVKEGRSSSKREDGDFEMVLWCKMLTISELLNKVTGKGKFTWEG